MLAPLGCELARDRFAAARGRWPCDIAQLVARLVLPQAFKLAAQSAQAEAALLEGDLPDSQQIELRIFRRPLHRRVYPDFLCQIRGAPALGKTQRAAIAEEGCAEHNISAGVRRAVDRYSNGIARICQHLLCRRHGVKRAMKCVSDAYLEDLIRRLRHFDGNPGGFAEHRRILEPPLDGDLFGAGQQGNFDNCERQHQSVPGHHRPDPSGMKKAGDREQASGSQQDERSRRERVTEAAVAGGSPDWLGDKCLNHRIIWAKARQPECP